MTGRTPPVQANLYGRIQRISGIEISLGAILDSSTLERLLAPSFLEERIAQHQNLNGASLLSAVPRAIGASGYLSDLTGVTLAWSHATGAPTRAVLKVSHPGFGQPELPFYERIAKHLHSPVIPRFYVGGVDEPTGRTWLLIEDLSESHQQPSEEPLPPTFDRCVHIVEALARFHATGWTRADGSDVAVPGMGPTLWNRLQTSEWLAGACERLFAQVGDTVDECTRDTYARFLSGLPALIERANQFQHRTLVHGDAHVWNWMVPRDNATGVAKLIDWDGWHVGAGVWDLAYMMALQWDRAVRQRFEMPLLDRYHVVLTGLGMTGYSREAFQEDYRLAVLLHLRTPMARFERGMSAFVWWPQLTRVSHAVEDLDCLDLLK